LVPHEEIEMGDIVWSIMCFGAGLLTAWIFLPEPKIVREFWEKMGWARKTTPTTPTPLQ
jgi:hypothetical protein